MNYKGAYKIIVPQLIKELDSNLRYHSIDHTLDVIESVGRLSKEEKIDTETQLLLKTAALFHDTGMLKTYAGHEIASVKIAQEILPNLGYNQDQIEFIAEMIHTTKLPQCAKTIEQQILCDADLDYLGREDYFMISHQLKFEWELLGLKKLSLKDWYKFQIQFLEGHCFYTKGAKNLRAEGKIKNLAQIKDLIS